MELRTKNLLCIVVLVLLPLVRGTCKDDLMRNEKFLGCVMNFSGFFTNLGSSGTDLSDPYAIFNVICSPEGKEAFSCMLGFMSDCPELMSAEEGGGDPLAALKNVKGFDMGMFMKEGGMEGVCALLVGPCSQVKNCYTIPHSGMVKRAAPSSVNYYLLFHSQTSLICGQMKQQMTCMLNALEQCPDSVVDQVEAEFEQALKLSMSDEYGVVSYKDTKTFILDECPRIPQDFSQDTCTKSVIVSQNFTECNENVTMKYSKARNCAVHDLSKHCIMEQVEPKCGKETAMFFARNSHIIFPGIPDDCESRDTSGSDVKRASFVTLLFSTLLILKYFW